MHFFLSTLQKKYGLTILHNAHYMEGNKTKYETTFNYFLAFFWKYIDQSIIYSCHMLLTAVTDLSIIYCRQMLLTRVSSTADSCCWPEYHLLLTAVADLSIIYC